MPVAFLRVASPEGKGGAGFAPLACLPFRLGSRLDNDLVDPSPGVGAYHAEVRQVRGAYLLVAGDGHSVRVGDQPVPVVSLRDGDVVRLGAQGRPWRFRNRLEGVDRSPVSSLAGTWLSQRASRGSVSGSARFGPGPPVGGRDPARCRRVETPTGQLVVKRFGPIRDAAAGDDHLCLLAALGGARHRALAALVDGGLESLEGQASLGGQGGQHSFGGECQRWAATRWVPGRCVRDLVEEAREEGGIAASRVFEILGALARGLAHLHRRGVVHRDVAPGNVILPPEGGAVLIDYGQSLLLDGVTRESAGVVGTPGFVAPEEVLAGRAAVSPAVDVYGLGAIGYALLTGMPPARGEDLLATLGQAMRPPVPPRELGVEVPEALEATLLQCLAPDPAHRHDAATVVAALDFAGAQVGFGDSV